MGTVGKLDNSNNPPRPREYMALANVNCVFCSFHTVVLAHVIRFITK